MLRDQAGEVSQQVEMYVHRIESAAQAEKNEGEGS